MTFGQRMAMAAGMAACVTTLGACATSHVDNPTVNVPPSVSYTATASGGGSTLPSPCTLADPVSIRRAVGGVVAPGSAAGSTAHPECDWTVTGSAEFGDGRLVIAFPAAQQGISGGPAVPGIGADAFYEPETGALTVLIGEHQLVVQGDFPAALAGPHAGALEVALTGIARLAAIHA